MDNADYFIQTMDIYKIQHSPGGMLLPLTFILSFIHCSLHKWQCCHLKNMDLILFIKLASRPGLSTGISVSLSHGNGSIGFVASKRVSIGIFAFDRSSAPISWLFLLGCGQ